MKTLASLMTMLLVALLALPAAAQSNASDAATQGDDIFIEAEDFTVQDNGWRINTGAQARRASMAKALNGASGNVASTATHALEVEKAGEYRLWVRYMVHGSLRGPFDVRIKQGDQEVASRTFDLAPLKATQWEYAWDHLDVTLQPGKYTLELAKHNKKNSSGYVRNVDCFLLTTDKQAEPDHLPYGPQTWMRFTLQGDHGGPVQVHLFADHFRSPWYAHYAISKDGMESGLNPKRKEARLEAGESTGWFNATPAIYQDSGARFYLYTAHTYHQEAETFNGTLEVATAPQDDAIVKTFHFERTPGKLQLIVPPNLLSQENIDNLKVDMDFSQEIGKLADSFDWPTIGKKPEKFPFFVSGKLRPETMGRNVHEREMKTVDYFGFNNVGQGFEKTGYTSIGNVGWYFDKTYSNPQTERMEKRSKIIHERQVKDGLRAENIVVAQVMDEPTGQPLALLAKDEPSIEAFRAWIKKKNLTPADLLVDSWDDVKLVTDAQRDQFPALYYYSQQFRTVALGDFIAIQKRILHENWQADFPINVNFSDGAVYYANFYGQGVDYFTLLRETDQNAIWSEDWSNRASTFHMATYNVELMRAAAREKGQHLGHHLIAYAGRKGYDVRLKAISEVARGVKIFKSYAYGPLWAGHDRSAWQSKPMIWKDHANAIREIGAVEDMLMPAMPKPAQVALIYASSSDIWAGNDNAQGFDRMHTWLALTHAQIPVDIVHEMQIEAGLLDGYKVAYYSGSNITRAAADRLAQWVNDGGTLVLTAGAGQYDEYNRPLDTLDKLLPFTRQPLEKLQSFHSGGRSLVALKPRDTVKAVRGGTTMNVLGSRQAFAAGKGKVNPSALLATFSDGSPAAIRARAGKGQIVAMGYLPALDYITKALEAKAKSVALDAGESDEPESDTGIPGQEAIHEMLPNEKSYNPWEYPADVRTFILQPVRDAKLDLPISCDVPLVDAIYMTCDAGVLVPLANYTLQPIAKMTLQLAVDKPVKEVRSVHQGRLQVKQLGNNRIEVTLPLDCTDFISVVY